MATATLDKLSDALGDLLSKREKLAEKEAEPTPLQVVDQEIERTAGELKAVQEAENHARLIELRKAEKAQMEKIIAAADALWKEIEPLDDIWREQKQVSPGAAPLAVIPRVLVNWLRPGWNGARRQWAHTKNFANFEYVKD